MVSPIEAKAIDILLEYKGSNDYIIWLKNQLAANQLNITRTQAKYVVDYHKIIPQLVNKYVPIHPFNANYFKSHFELSEAPTHILIYKILSRSGDDLHIWGAFEEKPLYHKSIFINKSAFKSLRKLPELDFDQYSRPPKPHQIEAVKTLLTNNNFILADDMGLGKTFSAIMAAHMGGFKKILVVCPASLKLNWRIEIGYVDSISNVAIVDGSDFKSSKWTIINYDILKYHHQIPTKGVETPISAIDFNKFDLVIADEAHYLKNATSARTKLFLDFSSRIQTKWLLTGTPITNKPIDFFSLLQILNSPLTNNWAAFVKRYCAGFQIKRKDGGKSFWKTSGASNLDELRLYTSDIILRRTKKELNLPPKTKKPLYLPLTMGQRYNQYMQEYEDWVRDVELSGAEMPVTAHLTKLTAVRQLLSQDKLEHTISLAEDYIAEGHKVIIFSCFTDSIRAIHEHFGKASVLVDGSVSSTKRQAAVEAFQNNEKTKVFCGNIVAAGVGLTLTEGSIVIFNDLDWTPANHAQAEDRAHRIGQEKDVHIVYPLVEGTIDETMYKTLQLKMRVISQVIGDDFIQDVESVLTSVLKSLRNP